MDNLTPEQIQERYDKLSPELKNALSSPDVHAAIQRIGQSKGLMIDQIGDLVDQVGMVILGFAKASNFVADITHRTLIKEDAARDIADQINKEILSGIRHSLESEENNSGGQPSNSTGIADLEKAGGFEIERPSQDDSVNKLKVLENGDLEGKSDIISGIENPAPTPPRPVTIKPPSVPVAPSTESPRKEPLVEQLLRGGTTVSEKKVVKQEQGAPVAAASPKQDAAQPKQPASDPYREPVEY